MLRNYLKVAFRNIVNEKFYSIINVTGFAVGLACCLLIIFFVKDELSYDRFNENADRIYRMHMQGKFGGNEFHLTYQAAPTAPAMIEEFPEVEDAVRFRYDGSWYITYEDKIFKEEELIYVDGSIFNIFSINMIEGNPLTALSDPYSVVLDEEVAEKYFGDEDPMGKTLDLEGKAYQVTGIIEKLPANSHFKFGLFASFITLEREDQSGYMQTWLSQNYQTYLLLREGADPEALEAKFPALVEKYVGPEVEQFLGVNLEEFAEGGNNLGYYLMPLLSIHLHSAIGGEFEANGSMTYVYIFSAIALFILVIACINFMNLATARSTKRALEVGIRKSLGSRRTQLILQFLSESVLMCVISMLLAIGIAELLLPFFNSLTGKELTSVVILEPEFMVAIMLVTLLVGLIAGSYPAFFLSGFKPAAVVKGDKRTGIRSGTFRSVLVIFQFCISIVLIISTAVVYKQLRYVQNKNLGFDKEQIITVHDAYVLDGQTEAFKEEVMRSPLFVSATMSSYLPVGSSRSNTAFFPEGNPSNENTTSMQIWTVDHDYITTMGMEIIAGRDFSADYSSDSLKVIVNEAVLRQFDWEDPVGQRISHFWTNAGDIRTVEVIGVVKNFHWASLRQKIDPVVISLGRSRGRVNFRVEAGKEAEAIALIESKWKEMSGGKPFEYSFIDQDYENIYRGEARVGRIFGVFAVLAILIACLGLFGLAAYTAEQRTKEIGVRKVMGASVFDLVMLLSKEFGRLVLISFVIGGVVSYLIMSRWLNDFEYKTIIGIEVFLVAGLLSFGIAWITMGYQSVKAAMANPVQSLKYE